MKNIEITLDINGKEKTYTCTKIKGILLRKTAEVVKVFAKMENGLDAEVLDEIVDYIVDVFGKQFSREDFYDGVDLDDMMPVIQGVAEQIMEKASSKIKN